MPPRNPQAKPGAAEKSAKPKPASETVEAEKPAKKPAKKPAVKPAAAPAPKAAKPEPAPPGEGLKLRDLVSRLADQSSAPKKLQREVAEQVLTILGQALAAGEEINLTGLGRLKVVKSAEKSGKTVLTVKVKGAGEKKAASGKEPLADAGEDS